MKFFKKFLKPIIIIFLLACILYNVVSVILQQPAKYLAHDYWQRFPSLKHAYLDSQYANKHPIWIVDEVAFAYAGGALIKGENPVFVVPDAPPFGKYLIGLSALIFNNEHIIIIIFALLSLILLYILGLTIFSDTLLGLLPVVLFSSEPIFKNQLIYTPLMDLFQLVFLLSYFLFVNKAFLLKKNYSIFFILAGVFLGMFIATKFFISGVTLIAASVIYLIKYYEKKKFVIYLLSLPIAIAILLISYARVFAFGYNFHEFLGIQKWVFLYHNGQLILPFSVWPLLFFNQWYVWFGNAPIIHDSQWVLTWPIITLLSFVTIIFYFLKKISQKKEIEVLMLWVVCYLGFLSSGLIFSRYFLILIPILYIIALFGVIELYKRYKHKFVR